LGLGSSSGPEPSALVPRSRDRQDRDRRDGKRGREAEPEPPAVDPEEQVPFGRQPCIYGLIAPEDRCKLSQECCSDNARPTEDGS
jgi:hypothetical protein